MGRHGDACRVSSDLASTVPLPVTQAKLVVWPQGFCQSVLKSRDLDGFKDGNPRTSGPDSDTVRCQAVLGMNPFVSLT